MTSSRRPALRPYVLLLAAWLVVAALGSLASIPVDGVDGALRNFLRYGMGLGVAIAVVLVVAYVIDRRLHARHEQDAEPTRTRDP